MFTEAAIQIDEVYCFPLSSSLRSKPLIKVLVPAEKIDQVKVDCMKPYATARGYPNRNS